jgi:curved DNA-binding protein CbpA
MTTNPFEILGLPERPDLDDETVRAAWRAIAAATHPDRADGGDLARYTAATAAFAKLRTPWARSEAYADLRVPGATPPRSPSSPTATPPRSRARARCRPRRRSGTCGSSRPGSGTAAACTWPPAPSPPHCYPWPC